MKVSQAVVWVLGFCLMFGLVASRADAQATQPSTQPSTQAAPEPADQAVMKVSRTGTPDARFRQLHDAFLWRGKEGPIGVLFLGDSITEGWIHSGNAAPDVWKKNYWQYHPADFGIGGDRTQHVIWRIEHGELDGISPKVVVLMIGTNNIGYTAEEITAGDQKIVAEIHEKLPDAKLLLLGIFPRGADPKDPKTADMRAKIKQVNSELAKLDDGNKTRYLDIGDKFLDGDGAIPKDIMKDALHPTPKGYQIWADAMQPLLDEMMK